MMTRPIKVKHKVYKRSAIPLTLAALFFLVFVAGYFTGGVIQALAYKIELEHKAHFMGDK